MNDEVRTEPWKVLAELAAGTEAVDALVLEGVLDPLSPGEIAMALSRLDEDERVRIISSLPAERAADIFEELSEAQAADILGDLNPTAAAGILDEVSSDERVDLLGEMPAAEAEAILDAMPVATAADVRFLSSYPEDVAGGLMVTEFVTFSDTSTVADVVSDLRNNADRYADYEVQYAYVVDTAGKLTGVLRLRDLLLARGAQPIARIMLTEPISVKDYEPLASLVSFFGRYDFLGVPVVDAEGKLVGLVQRNAVYRARSEEQDSTYLKSQGIMGGEEIRSMPLAQRAGRRLAWLSINIVLNIVAASVIAAFQDTLSAVIALAVFLPIISDMSGCSGSQAVAVSIRELALGLIRPRDLLRVWGKEIGVGIVNGAALGILIAGVAFAWKGNGYLGLVVGAALCLNTLIAVTIGGLVPLFLTRMRVDPAIAAGPILTTITDTCGFFLVLGIATLMLPHLVA